MKILIDENNVVRAWQTVGGGWKDSDFTAVEVDNIPEDVKECCEKFRYIDGTYADNPDYVEPEANEPTPTNTELAEQITELQMALCEIYESII